MNQIVYDVISNVHFKNDENNDIISNFYIIERNKKVKSLTNYRNFAKFFGLNSIKRNGETMYIVNIIM